MGPRARVGLALAGVAFAASQVAASPEASLTPPWSTPGDASPDEHVRSVRIIENDEPIYSEPRTTSPRRGAAISGAHLPVFATRHGHGCLRPWALVGPGAWVCMDRTTPSAAEAIAADQRRPGTATGLPLAYHFVGSDGAFGYDNLAEADVGVPDAQLQPGFAVAVVEVARRGGDLFGVTTKGLWLAMRDVHPVAPPTFRGVALVDGNLEIGWTFADETALYRAPGGSRVAGERLARWTHLVVQERRTHRDEAWARVSEDQWLRAEDVRLATPTPHPQELLPNERWIDVDLKSQIVVAYEGDRPVYATLASTGRGAEGTPRATPVGRSRIWVKLATSDMTNLEDAEANRYYAIEEVPWVMFFDRGVGLHGAFWHRSFGRVRSHGCVNLAPQDAEWMFDWASPRLPAGWRAVLPTDYDRGTLVSVR